MLEPWTLPTEVNEYISLMLYFNATDFQSLAAPPAPQLPQATTLAAVPTNINNLNS